MSDYAIELKSVHKTFKTGFWMSKVKALRGINLEIQNGEVFGYLGPNGSGKTTTLKLIMGIISPDSGDISVLSRSPRDITAKEKIGFLPEAPYFYDYLRAGEFLDFYARLFAIPMGVRRERIRHLLTMVGLQDKVNEPLRRFSRGMLQRVGIAQALINDPDLIILDEPMGGLDPLGRAQMKEIITELRNKGKTIIFSSHVLPDVEVIADRVGIIINGRIRDVGNLDKLLTRRVSSVEITVLGFSRLDKLLDTQLKGKATLKRVFGDRAVLVVDTKEKVDEVIDIIRDVEGSIESVEPMRMTLEELFLSELRKSQKTKKRGGQK